jgi:hypothetical protein
VKAPLNIKEVISPTLKPAVPMQFWITSGDFKCKASIAARDVTFDIKLK